ncbi:MAG: DNA primase [Phycisphaerales bacterium]|nr:DNA primase [Phycisphaerales bacterium]
MAKGLYQDNDDVQRVRDAVSIERIIAEHVTLKPKGREFAGLCPFHDDHNPSMAVVPRKQIFHCFVCGTGGDVFSFVQKFHKMDFREALEYLAQRGGIELKPRKAPVAGEEPQTSRSKLIEANATAAEFFKTIFRHPEHGATARAVVAKRGISDEMVERFQIGAAPDRMDGLLLTLSRKGLDSRVFVEAGLLRDREGRVYDTFRHRLMFPITDQIGRFIAFGGRKMRDEDEPKYLNSPESRVFNKSATLFGLAQAAKAIQVARTAVITEGYTDTIACHQAGLENAVATLGTALTREHAVILRRLCDRVVLLFDGDDAGQRAADRAAEIFFAEPLDVVVATLDKFTDAKDPDELLKREGGLAVLNQALAAGVDVLKYRFDRVAGTIKGGGIAARSRAVEQEVERLVELGLTDVEPVRKRMIVRELARLAGVDEQTVARAVPAGRGTRAATRRETEPEPSESARLATGPLTAAEALIGCVLCDPSLLTTLDTAARGVITPDRFAGEAVRALVATLLRRRDEGESCDLVTMLPALPSEAARSAATILAARTEQESGGDTAILHRHWNECLRLAQRESENQIVARETPTAPTADAAAIAATIARRAEQMQRLGADQRVFPRPK